MTSAPPIAETAAGPASGPKTAPMLRMRGNWRVFTFYSSSVLLTGLISWLFADLLWRTGWSLSGFVLLGLFTVLVLLISVGCMQGVFGFVLRLTGDRRITRLQDFRGQSIEGVGTALVFPIYNEQVPRVCEGLR